MNSVSKKIYLTLEANNAYTISSKISDDIWKLASEWDWFNKNTLGVQFVRATDSIAGNIAEGFGRHHKKDKQKFIYNTRGSVYESLHWIKKAKTRNLLKDNEYILLSNILESLPKELNWLVKITEEKLKM